MPSSPRYSQKPTDYATPTEHVHTPPVQPISMQYFLHAPCCKAVGTDGAGSVNYAHKFVLFLFFSANAELVSPLL